MNQKAGGRCTVLVVEDEWLIRMELVDALANAGLEVLEASAGEDALAYLEPTNTVDVLVTDIRLLGPLSGWDIAETFRSAHPSVGVIYASANPPLKTRQVTGSVFFAKPAPVPQVVETCCRLCQNAAS